MKWLDRKDYLFVIFILLFILNALSGILLSSFIAYDNTAPLPLGELMFVFILAFTFVATTFVFWKLRKNLRKIRDAIITTIVLGAIFCWLLYAIGLLPFPAFVFQTPYFIATGWIYYVLHIAKNIRFNATEIVLGIVILALLIVGLHVFVRWFYAELKLLRSETPATWQLRWTLVSVAIFILMFVTGISTTVSIHQLIWIAKTQKQLEMVGGEKSKVRALESGAKGAVSGLQGYLDSYAAGDPYIIVTDSSGKAGCIEAGNAATTGKTCQAVYNEVSSAVYTPFPGGMDEVLGDFINHHTNKGDKSPHTGLSLFVANHTTQGEVVLTPINSRAVSITAYAEDVASPIFSQVVTARID
ncbi:MAG: hypothetical protein HQL05_10755 [Nitrospirae bacterium]|uniref:hypothetical protein n=1 Tax=Candidatus Magnetobacterium casense TaxID=1455061 RepID=UPI000590123C|nr:hypothetical protein [Candidatus Magnetobacterium casensis]MBF0338299.1 hypothetical protein [Nitrospirota bacterium]